MIIYNITNKVRWEILESWLAWQIEDRIPAILSTGLFDGYHFYRLLEQDEEEGPTFVIQFLTASIERYRQFMTDHAYALQQASWEKWNDGFIAFGTVMETI